MKIFRSEYLSYIFEESFLYISTKDLITFNILDLNPHPQGEEVG